MKKLILLAVIGLTLVFGATGEIPLQPNLDLDGSIDGEGGLTFHNTRAGNGCYTCESLELAATAERLNISPPAVDDQEAPPTITFEDLIASDVFIMGEPKGPNHNTCYVCPGEPEGPRFTMLERFRPTGENPGSGMLKEESTGPNSVHTSGVLFARATGEDYMPTNRTNQVEPWTGPLPTLAARQEGPRQTEPYVPDLDWDDHEVDAEGSTYLKEQSTGPNTYAINNGWIRGGSGDARDSEGEVDHNMPSPGGSPLLARVPVDDDQVCDLETEVSCRFAATSERLNISPPVSELVQQETTGTHTINPVHTELYAKQMRGPCPPGEYTSGTLKEESTGPNTYAINNEWISGSKDDEGEVDWNTNTVRSTGSSIAMGSGLERKTNQGVGIRLAMTASPYGDVNI